MDAPLIEGQSRRLWHQSTAAVVYGKRNGLSEWPRLTRPGPAWPSLVRPDPVLVQSGLDTSLVMVLVMSGPVLVRCGSIWSGPILYR